MIPTANKLTKQWWACKEKYKLQKLVGDESFGTVVMARQRETGQQVTIKMIPDVGRNEVFARQTFRKVYILRKLTEMTNNNHTTQLLDFFVSEEDEKLNIFLVQVIYKKDIKSLLSTSKAHSKEKLKQLIYYQLCALNYIHTANLIHRDIRPANFLVNADSSLVLSNFGQSRAPATLIDDDYEINKIRYNLSCNNHEPRIAKKKMSSCLVEIKMETKQERIRDVSMCVQSRTYRAPEVALVEPHYDQRIDIWSMGCIIAELIHSQSDTCQKRHKGNHKSQHLFYSDSSFPLSPKVTKNSEDLEISFNDLLIKILEVVDSDVSFIRD